jgi:hypothetical protein
MKLNKFNDICQAKWDDGRGDVQELHLRENSFDELWKDILVDRTRPVSILNASAVLNHITRSEVRIRITKAPKDFVVVYYKAGWKEKADIDDVQDSG